MVNGGRLIGVQSKCSLEGEESAGSKLENDEEESEKRQMVGTTTAKM